MEQPRPSLPAQPDGSALCTTCGLCCDSLFTRVGLAPEDLPLARRSAGGVVERDDGPHALLPCSFLVDRVCTVYAERYAACRRFTCKLLRAFVQGDVDTATAHGRVAEMRRRLDDVRAIDAALDTPIVQLHDDVAAWRDLPDKAERQDQARRQLTAVACNLYANKYFRNVPDPRALA